MNEAVNVDETTNVAKASQASNDVELKAARPDFSSDDEDQVDAEKALDKQTKKKKSGKKKKAKQMVYSGKLSIRQMCQTCWSLCNSNNFAYCFSDDEGDNAEALELSGSEASELSGSEASDVEDEEVEKYVEYDSDENEVDPSTTIYRNNTLCHEM